MNRFADGFDHLVPRSPPAVLQLGLTIIGLLVILSSIGIATIMLTRMPPSESGFAEGLVFLVFGLYTLVGFIVFAVGLLIPQRDADGIHFTQTQRRLLGYGVIAPLVSVLSIPVGATVLPPLPLGVNSLLVGGLVGLLLSGPLAIILAVGLKLRQ